MRGQEQERALAAWVEGRGMPCRREDNNANEVGPPPPQKARESQGRLGDKVPGGVRPVRRFRRDMACLLELTELPEPPKQLYRAKHVMGFFIIGDASGLGKGVAVVEQCGVEYEAGPWKMQWRKESSNVREAKNLTNRIKRLGSNMVLTNHEVFVMTNNTAFEVAYYKEHPPNAKLNNIIFRLHKAERDGGFILHVLHISGKRMNDTGVDGLSRGNLIEGMLAGVDPISFLPFN